MPDPSLVVLTRAGARPVVVAFTEPDQAADFIDQVRDAKDGGVLPEDVTANWITPTTSTSEALHAFEAVAP